jgi:hypothetical protein
MASYCTKLSYLVLLINVILANSMFILFYFKLNINKTMLIIVKVLFDIILVLIHPFLLIIFNGVC